MRSYTTAREMIAKKPGRLTAEEKEKSDEDAYVLLQWYVTTDDERKFLELPMTRQEWSERYDRPMRWVENQIGRSEFKQAADELKMARYLTDAERATFKAAKVQEASAGAPVKSQEERFADLINLHLDGAAAGVDASLKFIQTASVQKYFLERMNQDGVSTLPDKSDVDLVVGFVERFQTLVLSALRRMGFTVERSETVDL